MTNNTLPMGAWGEKTFESDKALDFFADFCESSQSIELLEETFDCIILNQVYLDASACEEALVSGEIIAFIKQKEGLDFPSNKFHNPYIKLEVLRLLIHTPLVYKAIEAILKVRNFHHSELRQLWEETETSYPIWQSNITNLIERLSL